MTSLTSQSITEKSPYYFSTPSPTTNDHGLDSGDNCEIVAIVQLSKVDRPWSREMRFVVGKMQSFAC